MGNRKILFAYHRHRGLDPKLRPSPWSTDLPSLYRSLYPDSVSTHFFDNDVIAGRDVDQGFIRACLEAKPDLVVYYPIQSPDWVAMQPSPAALSEVSNDWKIPIFAYLGDAWFHGDEKEAQAREWSECCDRLIICEPRSKWHEADWAKGHLVSFWFARDPAIFRPRFEQRDIEVSFPGSVEQYPERRELLSRLKQGGTHVVQQGGVSEGVFLSIEELATLFSRSYMVLNFTSIPGLEGVKPIRGRVWEALLSGCLLFEEVGSSAEHYFEPGRHYIAFENLSDLCEKIERYLRSRKEGEAIALAGCERARNVYSPGCAIQILFDALDSLEG